MESIPFTDLGGSAAPSLPQPRGELTEALFGALRGGASGLCSSLAERALTDDPLYGEDVPLALYALYELHYRGFAGVDDVWEWDPDMLALRRRLEIAFTARLRDEVGAAFGSMPVAPKDVAAELERLATADGPSVSAFMARNGTPDQMREFAIHRSAYQRKEADPHTWAIPRLTGTAKAALITIQTDEYGGGHREAMHSELFADTMRALGLDPSYGVYLDVIPGVTLSTVNLVSLFGLHRRWRGALVGHLALFEMTSIGPMRRYADAVQRMGIPDAAPFYRAHVVADEWHQHLALSDLVGGLIADDPGLSDDVVFGARALTHLEGALARRLLTAWSSGDTALLHPARRPITLVG